MERQTAPSRSEARRRALRLAVIVAGLTVPSAGCERVMNRVLHGTAVDGTQCVGWSLSHGSPASCCADYGGAFDAASGRCDIPVDYGVVEGPFVPPADPRELA